MRKILLPVLLVFGLLCAPVAHADTGDQISAEQAVTALYNRVIPGCTEGHNVASIVSISWGYFWPNSWGEGRINDANSALGGPFKAYSAEPALRACGGQCGRAGIWPVEHRPGVLLTHVP